MKLQPGTLGKTALLVTLYIVTGKLGLLFALPPGYATVIWPPSGIALGMLIVYGWRLWPGVLIGSLLLNAHLSGALSWEHGISFAPALTAFAIAVGSTLQCLIGRALVARFVGLPLRLERLRQLHLLFGLAGPVACTIAPTIGVGALWLAGTMSSVQFSSNWFAWWCGDLVGVIVFLPLVLIWPRDRNRVMWRGADVRGLPLAAMLMLMLPLGLTFYAWKIAGDSAYQQTQIEFGSLAAESEKALLHRLDSYSNALLGGVGFFQGSTAVSRDEWRRYVDALQTQKNFPGISGLGWIAAVSPEQLPRFLEQARQDGAPQFKIRPNDQVRPLYVITYLEPEHGNEPAIGLNIAFEVNRLQAANLARDHGRAAITHRIVLVQDEQKTPGFLLLYPKYRSDLPVSTAAERRAALEGWIYAPFIARNLLHDLTSEQGRALRLKIYDGEEESPQSLIYSDAAESDARPGFTVRRHLEVMQQKWLVVWESTPTFERRQHNSSTLFILLGGLFFTAFFTLFLVVVSLRRTETLEWMGGEGRYALPLAVFLLIASGSYVAFQALAKREFIHVQERVHDEVGKIALLLNSRVNDRLLAIKRMSQRWQAAGGTPHNLWEADARSYVNQLGGLRALEWVDATYHVRWVVPISGNQRVIGLNVANDPSRAEMLTNASVREGATVTGPIDLLQGYKGFLLYQPLLIGERFDGFLVGVFSVQDFFGSAVGPESSGSYALMVDYDGVNYFNNGVPLQAQDEQWRSEQTLRILDKEWVLRLVPTRAFVASQGSALPVAVMVAGLLIAMLSAISLRYILMSRLKSERLAESNQLNSTILARTPYLVIATDLHGKVITFNRASETALGYSAEEVVGKHTPALWHDPVEVAERGANLSGELNNPIRDGFELLHRPLRLGSNEASKWTFIRKNGTRFPVHLAVTPLRDHRGVPTGYLGVIEDVTERRQQEQALRTSEETFRTAMQHAPIGQVLISPEGRWLKVNPALCRLVGFSEEDLLSGRLRWLTAPDSDDNGAALGELLSGQVQTCQLEKIVQRRDGRTISILLSVSLVRRVDLQPDYLIAQVQDITERKEMERIKNEFISVVSHELRTPLTSIRGSLGLLLGAFAVDLPQKMRGLIEIAYNNCERLIPLINDILDIDKIASGHMRFEMKEESVAALIQQAVQANEAYARKFNVSIAVAPIEESLRVNVDAARTIQVLSNLLSNAAKFSPPGGTIDVAVYRQDGDVLISVRDYGEGIPEEFRSRIFSKFSQADSSATRAKGGTGLGLHIARQLVEQMHGHIGFQTASGEGTNFWIEFPLLSKTAGKSGGGRFSEVAAASSVLHFREGPKGAAEVLHIEDDEDLGDFVATALQGTATTYTVATLAEAEALLARKKFSLILLDIKLPDGSGVDLLERVRAIAGSPPVVILATNEPPPDISRKAAAVMVKTRTSEAAVVQTVLKILQENRGAPTPI